MSWLLWDFEGTLAIRDGKWAGAVRDAISQNVPGLILSQDDIRPHLSTGFPWHAPEIVHNAPLDSNLWWGNLRPVLSKALDRLGLSPEAAARIACDVRAHYLNPAAWRSTSGAIASLAQVRSCGWRVAIVSNHVPELRDLIGAVGLNSHVDEVFCSAHIGTEKPNPRIFEFVFEALGRHECSWMIGDSVEKDILGAANAGLSTILVNAEHAAATHCVRSVIEVPPLVGEAW